MRWYKIWIPSKFNGICWYTRATSPGNAIANLLRNSAMSDNIYPDDFEAIECDEPPDGSVVVAGGGIPKEDE